MTDKPFEIYTRTCPDCVIGDKNQQCVFIHVLDMKARLLQLEKKGTKYTFFNTDIIQFREKDWLEILMELE